MTQKDENERRAIESNKHQAKICSKCKRIIQPGEYYEEDVLSDEINCSEYDANRILVKRETFFSVD